MSEQGAIGNDLSIQVTDHDCNVTFGRSLLNCVLLFTENFSFVCIGNPRGCIIPCYWDVLYSGPESYSQSFVWSRSPRYEGALSEYGKNLCVVKFLYLTPEGVAEQNDTVPNSNLTASQSPTTLHRLTIKCKKIPVEISPKLKQRKFQICKSLAHKFLSAI